MARVPQSPFRSLTGQRPSIQQQLNVAFKGLDALSHHLSELSLRLEFTMRQIQLSRTLNSGLVGANGKQDVQRLSLMHLFEEQREVFAQMLLDERQVLQEAMAHEIASAHANGHSGEGVDAGDIVDPADPGDEDDATDPSLDLDTSPAPRPFGKRH